MTRVLVAGGGIVGLTTALALRRAGLDVTVAEQAAEIRATGTSLGLWRNALDVFDGLGIGGDIRAIGRPSTMYFHDPTGHIMDTPGSEPEDHRYLLVNRPLLNDALAEAVGHSRIRLSARITDHRENADGVTVRYADGGSDTFDLLVGADGLYSAVRARLVPGSAARPHPGHHTWRALVPPGSAPLEHDAMTVGHRGCRGGCTRTHDGGAYWLLAQFGSPEPTGDPKTEALERAHHLADGGWNDRLLELIEATPDESVLHNPILVVPPLPRWTSRRVVLVGDAAHAMSPHITAGASLGVEDAAVLARHLTAHHDAPTALAAYERDRMPRHRHARRLADSVEAYRTPQEFARRYAAFSHWMINSGRRGLPEPDRS